MNFYRHDDGTVTVDQFDDEITISIELINSPDLDPEVMRFWAGALSVDILGVTYHAIDIPYRGLHGTVEWVTYRREGSADKSV